MLSDPRKVVRCGPGYDHVGDPLRALQNELQDRVVGVPGIKLPNLAGGAVGYLSYDCIQQFEPTTAAPWLKDNVQIPDAMFMIYDTVVAFDHFQSTITVVTHIRLPDSTSTDIRPAYEEACALLRSVLATIHQAETALPPQAPASEDPASSSGNQYSSNVGRSGYEAFITKLKRYIIKGDIVQAVPSQRLSRNTTVHPFNIYRTLRSLNPSPYMFYLSCSNFSLVGASPECLMSASTAGGFNTPRLRIVNHAIAGTIARGKNSVEDDELARRLQNSVKDRAEHVMLVDLARNDVNRVCDPQTVRVDHLMRVDKFSHVQHLTSEVSGMLRTESTRWDAFRSIFPAGTVSGAPKIRAAQLISELEQEKRGVYAGAVGWFGYDSVRNGEVAEGPVDTCIAIRTMLIKDGVAHLQAGGGCVYDSDEFEEWMETMNKLGANLRCIELAEQRFEGRISAKTVGDIIEEQKREGRR